MPKDFSRGILESGVKRSPLSLRRLFDSIDSDADGRITWPEFKSVLGKSMARNRPQPVSSSIKKTKKKKELPSWNQIERAVRLERLRNELRRHVVTQGQLFYFMDKNRNDLISLGEFRHGLEQSNIHYPDEDTETLFRDIDSDQDLRISWQELQDALNKRGSNKTIADDENVKLEISRPAPPPPTPVLGPSPVLSSCTVDDIAGKIDDVTFRLEENEEEQKETEEENVTTLAESLKRLRQKIIEHDAVVSPSKETTDSPSKETTDMDEEIQDDVIIAAKERLRDAMSRKTMFGITVAVKKLEALVGSKDPDVREGRCMIELFEIGEEEEELKHRGDRRVRKTNELPSPVVSVATSTTSLSTILGTKETLLKKFNSAKTSVPRKITTYRDAVKYVSQQARVASDSKPRNTWTVSQEIRRRRFEQQAFASRTNDDGESSSSGADWGWIEKQYKEIEK